jgi:hypothetical protein
MKVWERRVGHAPLIKNILTAAILRDRYIRVGNDYEVILN